MMLTRAHVRTVAVDIGTHVSSATNSWLLSLLHITYSVAVTYSESLTAWKSLLILASTVF